jgi:hypothetical protein
MRIELPFLDVEQDYHWSLKATGDDRADVLLSHYSQWGEHNGPEVGPEAVEDMTAAAITDLLMRVRHLTGDAGVGRVVTRYRLRLADEIQLDDE